MKRLLAVIVLFFSLFLIAGCEPIPEKGDLIEVTVILNDGDSDISSKVHEIEESSSAYELLDMFYEIKITQSAYGSFLNEIKIGNHVISDDEGFFIEFIINGESAVVGIAGYFVSEDDVLTFKLTKIEW